MVMRPVSCDDPNRLRALLEDRLPPDEQAALSGHLEGCALCRAALERLAAESRWWDDARQLADDEFVGHGPETTHHELHADHPPFDFLSPPASPGYLGRFGPYDVIEFLGQGGSGLVFKAFDPSLHRLVAVKVLAPQVAVNATARRRFLREARAAASVSHDHVVTIHAVEEANGLPYLVMQYVAGKSLQERIDRTGPLELKEILRIGIQAASGLAAAHAQGLIHRDVKPANILLENGIERVKLTDFGLARAVDDASLTQSGVIAGTPQYMAPEQARGEAVDPRADLFGLGCVLYATATGHSPFRAKTTMAVLRRVCDESPRPIRDSNPEIPPWLAAIIDRLLAKDPADRHASAAEVAAVFSSHLARLQQASDPQPTLTSGAPRPARSRIAGRLAAAVFAVLLAVGASEAMGVSHVTDFVATVLRISFGDGTLLVNVEDPNVNVLVDGQDIVITGAGPREIRLKPGQHRLLAVKDGHRAETFLTVNRGQKRVALVELEESNRPRIALDTNELLGPDGRRRFSVPRAPQSQAEARPSQATPAPDRAIGEVVPYMGPDGGRKTLSQPDDKALLPGPVPRAAGELSIEPPPPLQFPRMELTAMGSIRDLVYSPDGRYLAAADASNTVFLFDNRTEKPPAEAAKPQRKGPTEFGSGWTFKLKLDSPHPVDGIAFDPTGKRIAVGTSIGLIGIWDVAAFMSGEDMAKKVLRIETGNATHFGKYRMPFAFSPKGDFIAVGGSKGAVMLSDASTGQALLELTPPTPTPAIASLSFDPGGKVLAASIWPANAEDRGVILWKLSEGTRLKAERMGVLQAGRPSTPARLIFVKPGLLLTYGPGPVCLWDLASRRGTRHPLGPEVNTLAVSRDGKVLAAGSSDGRVIFMDLAGHQHGSIRAAQDQVQGLALSPDGKSLATYSGGTEFRVLVWDVPAPRPQAADAGEPLGLPENQLPPLDKLARSEAGAADLPPPQGAPNAARELARTILEQAEHRLATARGEGSIAAAQVAQAKAEVEPIRVELTRREAELNRVQGQVKQHTVGQEVVDEAESRVATARAEVRSAEIGVRIAEARAKAAQARLAEAEAERDLARLNLDMFDGRDAGLDRREASRQALAQFRTASATANRAVAAAALEKAKADLTRANAERTFREKQAQRLRKLHDQGVVGEQAFDESQADHLQAIAAEKAAEAAVHAAEAQFRAAQELAKQAEHDATSRPAKPKDEAAAKAP